MGRADLIGNGKKHLVPAWQPAGTEARRLDESRRAAQRQDVDRIEKSSMMTRVVATAVRTL